MTSYIRVSLPDGRQLKLYHGDEIGRSGWAALKLDSRRIPESHARVSHRREGFVLQTLRGTIFVDGRAVPEILLEAGQTVVLADGTPVRVDEVHLGDDRQAPDTTMYAEIPPLRLVVGIRTVTLEGGGLVESVVLTGKAHALVSTVIAYGQPVPWYWVARRLWPKPDGVSSDDHKGAIRARWDQTVYRTRRMLQRAGLPREVLVSTGGNIVIGLLPGDEVTDAADGS